MNKEEILEKAREENKDEREESVRDQSIKWTFLTMVILSALFAYIRASQGQSMMDLTVVVCGSVCVSFSYRFFKTGRRTFLILGIVLLLTAILALIRFCLGY